MPTDNLKPNASIVPSFPALFK